MKTAFSYARVSTLEQKEKKNSIKEQFLRNDKFANDNGIEIIQKFYDSDSAFHDENRNEFDKMIKLALEKKPNFIIFDDSSRFARTRKIAIDTKKLLRSHGVNILYASEPNIDTNTVAGFWLEGIQEIKNEATSREIAFHTKKGMSGNLHQRDIETGWCYKNGGKAPYGYKRVVLDRGINQKGKPIYKTIWELDENTFPIARKIIVEMYTEKAMSYTKIRDYLNNNNIRNSNGEMWSTSTIVSMLREDRLEEYCGTAIWNKENKNVIGVKYNSKNEWIICENAHPAIITKEEFQNALKRKLTTNNKNYKFNTSSDYLLTGLNIENNFLFTCSECGGHIIGYSSGKKHIKKYICSTYNHKGNCVCSNNWRIEKDWIENKIIDIIERNYLNSKKIDKIVDKLYNNISNLNTIYSKEVKNIDTAIKNTDNQIQNLLNSIKSGVNPKLVVNEINSLEKSKEDLFIKKSNLLNSINNKHILNKSDIKDYFYNFKKLFINSNTSEKKELIKTFISNISLNKKEHHVQISLFDAGCAAMEQVAGIEPA